MVSHFSVTKFYETSCLAELLGSHRNLLGAISNVVNNIELGFVLTDKEKKELRAHLQEFLSVSPADTADFLPIATYTIAKGCSA